MSVSTDKYVNNRAELLANLFLTRRRGVRVLSLADTQDSGLDLLVRLPASLPEEDAEQFEPSFGVQIKGTNESLEDEALATKYANEQWRRRDPKPLFLAPVLILLFSMEGDHGFYSWLMQPKVGKEGPILARVSPLQMKKLTKKAVENLFDEVEEWFVAMTEMLLDHAVTK